MHGKCMEIVRQMNTTQTKQSLPKWGVPGSFANPRCFPLRVALAHTPRHPTSNIQHPVTDHSCTYLLPALSPPCSASPLLPFSRLLQPSPLLSPPPPLPSPLTPLARSTASSMLLSLLPATCEFNTIIELSMRTPRSHRRAFSTLSIHTNHADIGNLQQRHCVYLH